MENNYNTLGNKKSSLNNISSAESLSFKHPKHFNFLTQTNLSLHNTMDSKVINGAKKLTPLTGSRSSSSSNRYQNAAAAAIDFDYLEEKLKQIQTSSDNSKKLLPTHSMSNPTLKSSIKPITPRKSEEKTELETDFFTNENNANKKINFKLKEGNNNSSKKKELQRSISNMDHQRPVTTSSLKQKLNLTREKSLRQTNPQQHNRAQSQLSYSTNKLSQSTSHYDSQPIYEDDFIDEYTEDDDDDDFNEQQQKSSSSNKVRENSNTNNNKKNDSFFNGKHIPNRSVSNMSYTNKLKHQHNNSNFLNVHKKSRSTHLSHMDMNSSSNSSCSRHHSSSSSTTSSSSNSSAASSRSSSFDNIVKNKKSNKFLTKIDERRVNSANNKMTMSYTKTEQINDQLNDLQPRRASTANLTTPRSIVIRREKSINARASAEASITNSQPLNTNRSNASDRNSLSSKIFENGKESLKKQEYNQQEHVALKQSLLASITTGSNLKNGLNVKENSSTTSGIESSSKNSSSNGHESNDCKLSIENSSSVGSPTLNNNTNTNSYIVKINELKNSLFILDIELKNERKKLAVEKDLKSKLVIELKKRFQVEKEAALKAQEAKLNAEKLYELNKIREDIDLEKRDQYYQTQKSFDSELISLQLKLREKSEKCNQLEKLLKDERTKNNQLYMKSMEVVRKYNQELKTLKKQESENVQNTNPNPTKSSTISIHTQTIDDQSLPKYDLNDDKIQITMLKKNLDSIWQILNSNKNEISNSIINEGPLNCTNVTKIFNEIEQLAKTQNKNLNNLRFDQKSFKDQILKLNNEIAFLKDSKSKLETLYKIKCKSDLNKSAQIKKIELNHEAELLKLRNDFNYDLVGFLKNKISHKDSLLTENFYQLNNLLDLIKKSTSDFVNEKTASSQKNCEILQIKNFLENLINLNFEENNQADMIVINNLTNDSLKLNLNNIYKKPIVNLLYNNNNTDKKNFKVKSSDLAKNGFNCWNQNDKNNQIESQKKQLHLSEHAELSNDLNSDNLKIQEELSKIDKQLNDMKVLNTNLLKGKQDTLIKSEFETKLPTFTSTRKFNFTSNQNLSNDANNKNVTSESVQNHTSNNNNHIELDDINCNSKSLKSEIIIKNLNQKHFISEYNSYTLNSNINPNANTNNNVQINKSTSLNSLNKLKRFSQINEFILPEEDNDEHTNPSVNINKHISENLDETISIEFDFNNNNHNDNTNKIENCLQLIKKLNI